MDKRFWHHMWAAIRPMKTWYLAIATLVALGGAGLALRSNNLQMVRLRDAVYAADKDNGNVEQALQNLRAYVAGHMNTNLMASNTGVYPPIQLKYTFERLQQTEKQRVDGVNARVYPDAQAYCEQLYPGSFSGGPRVPCIENYVATHGTTPHAVPDSLYKFSFISPSWSPDAAGWSLVGACVLAFLTIVRAVIGRLARRFL